MIRKIAIAAIVIVVILLCFRYCEFKKTDSAVIDETALIQEQIRNVSKLVVTEGHFSEVITYKDQQKYLLDMLSFEKKALVVVNADVTVSYDLSQIEYDIDNEAKTITIKHLPQEEIKIHPELKFYDVQQNGFNEFTGDDYNKINAKVKESLRKKIEGSTLKSNAQNRLLSELSKLLILTSTMDWTLKYNGNNVNNRNLDTLFKTEGR